MERNKLVNNWHEYCDELDRPALDVKKTLCKKRNNKVNL